jgi:hypothetical protein
MLAAKAERLKSTNEEVKLKVEIQETERQATYESERKVFLFLNFCLVGS